jgi:hypothetical protein
VATPPRDGITALRLRISHIRRVMSAPGNGMVRPENGIAWHLSVGSIGLSWPPGHAACRCSRGRVRRPAAAAAAFLRGIQRHRHARARPALVQAPDSSVVWNAECARRTRRRAGAEAELVVYPTPTSPTASAQRQASASRTPVPPAARARARGCCSRKPPFFVLGLSRWFRISNVMRASVCIRN